MEEKFKLGKKWFWIGVIISAIYPLAGLIYGIALILEKPHRKTGVVLILITIAFAVIAGITLRVLIGKRIINPIYYYPKPFPLPSIQEGMPISPYLR